LITTGRRPILVSSCGPVSDPVLRDLDNSRPLILFAYLIQFTAQEPHPPAGVEAGAIPRFSELRGRNWRITLRAKKRLILAHESSRLGLRIEQLFTAICANLKGCLLFLGNLLRRVLTIVRPQTALFQQLTIYAPEIGNRPGGRCAASGRKTSTIPQAFHRLWNKSCGPSGTPRILRMSDSQLFRRRSSVGH
jgi:hypothetical protein